MVMRRKAGPRMRWFVAWDSSRLGPVVIGQLRLALWTRVFSDYSCDVLCGHWPFPLAPLPRWFVVPLGPRAPLAEGFVRGTHLLGGFRSLPARAGLAITTVCFLHVCTWPPFAGYLKAGVRLSVIL